MPWMKVAGYAVIVVTVLAFVKWYSDRQFDAGYNAATAEQAAIIEQERAAAVDQARQEWENTTEVAETVIETNEVIREVIREVEVEVPVVVERVVTVKPDCADLGNDVAGLLSRQARAGLDRENESTGPPANIDD